MHIILGALGLIVTILFLLSRLADAGIDLGGLNPFLWKRRRAWRRKVEGNPIFGIQEPKDIAAVLVVAVAKIDGDMSAEEKLAVLGQFERTLGLKPQVAAELLGSSAYLLGDATIVRTQLDAIIANARERMSPAQVASVLSMMESVAAASGTPSTQQQQMIAEVRAGLSPPPAPQGTWS